MNLVIKFSLALLLVLTIKVEASADPRYVCSFCTIVLGLVEQAGLQVRLESKLMEKCNGNKICEKSVSLLISKLESKAVPETLCGPTQLNACQAPFDQCIVYDKWPVSLPDAPISWPVERKLVEDESNELYHVAKILTELATEVGQPSDLMNNNLSLFGYIVAGLTNIFEPQVIPTVDTYAPCGANLTCHIAAISGHMPLVDHDGDRYSSKTSGLRGTNWRGTDCDDSRNDVYPGRLNSGEYDNTIDHNCNGIYGGNATGSYEDIFCANSSPRGLIMLGDSATAHFHIPPQWVTAQGWNLNGILPFLTNEMDYPSCSWGTAFMTDMEKCPYQHQVPDVTGITSLYSQLRDRNRCNHNDFQNVGVNGARMTSSNGLVDALARDQVNDNPVLLWLSLIGNDVCNGHEGFDHMTKPDDFYNAAMESLNKLDTMLPANSYVVSLALFDGELLYDTMHAKQHPIGTKYSTLYDYLNCMTVSPCWGWLNSNGTDRRMTTHISNELNRVYSNISKTSSFKNFKYIYYAPKWVELFNDYYSADIGPMSNLIEAVDGFHPSQAGNALFAKSFWNWFLTNHPDALGPVNPYNDEIDRMFFSSN